MSALTDKLFVDLQRLLPARLIGALAGRLARSRRVWLKNVLISIFSRWYDIEQAEMDAAHPTDYPSFNAFFTRSLKPGARPIDTHPNSVCCPADGTVQQVGEVSYGRIIQAKGMTYSAVELLGAEAQDVEPFDGGAFLTIYLAPHNYHRVHAPLDGRLNRMHFMPGHRYSVNRATVEAIPGLFSHNERVACRFEGPRGPFWLVFVGAMNVASISTAWAGEVVGGDETQQIIYEADSAPTFKKGANIGHFNIGSTVILLFPRETVRWDPALQPRDTVTVGRRIGSL